MQITNIHNAKTNLSKLINRVKSGEEIIIGKAGKPVAKIIPYSLNNKDRKGGQWKGQVKMSNDFDILPNEILNVFNGNRNEYSH